MPEFDFFQDPDETYDESFGFHSSRHSLPQPLSTAYASGGAPMSDLFNLEDFSQHDSPSSSVSASSGYPFPSVTFDPNNLAIPTQPLHGRRSAPSNHAHKASLSVPGASTHDPEQNTSNMTVQQDGTKSRAKSRTSRINHNHSEARYRSRLNSSLVSLAELIPQAYLRSTPGQIHSPLSAPASSTAPISVAVAADEGQITPLLGPGGDLSPTPTSTPQQPHYLKREVLDAAAAYIRDLRATVKQASDDLARISGDYGAIENRNRELEERVRDLNSRLMAFEYITQTREMLIG